MIQPTALSAAPALTPGGFAPVETPEGQKVSGEFAILLGLQLDPSAERETPVKIGAVIRAPVVPQPTDNPGGKLLPDSSPLSVPATEETTLPTAENGEDSPVALIAALLQLPIVPPADGPAATQAASAHPQVPVPLRHPTAPATVVSAGPLPTQSAPQSEAKAEPALPAVVSPTLPRLTLSAAEEKSRPAIVESASIIASAPDSEAAPTLTLPSNQTFAMPQASPTAISAATPRPQVPQDFATLVDRLVEARDTALSVQVPQAFSTSIAHADFGEVSIRFEHGGDAISVALSNPDPEFTRAVQAATPSAQTNTRDDNGAQPGRQDAQAQQTGTSSGHSPQSQPQQRQTGNLARNPPPHGRDEDTQQGRSGIFA